MWISDLAYLYKETCCNLKCCFQKGSIRIWFTENSGTKDKIKLHYKSIYLTRYNKLIWDHSPTYYRQAVSYLAEHWHITRKWSIEQNQPIKKSGLHQNVLLFRMKWPGISCFPPLGWIFTGQQLDNFIFLITCLKVWKMCVLSIAFKVQWEFRMPSLWRPTIVLIVRSLLFWNIT